MSKVCGGWHLRYLITFTNITGKTWTTLRTELQWFFWLNRKREREDRKIRDISC